MTILIFFILTTVGLCLLWKYSQARIWQKVLGTFLILPLSLMLSGWILCREDFGIPELLIFYPFGLIGLICFLHSNTKQCFLTCLIVTMLSGVFYYGSYEQYQNMEEQYEAERLREIRHERDSIRREYEEHIRYETVSR